MLSQLSCGPLGGNQLKSKDETVNQSQEGKILRAQHNGLRFEIEQDYPQVGAYLYVYEGDKCVKDFLQDTVSDCQSFALEEYGVPTNIWKEE